MKPHSNLNRVTDAVRDGRLAVGSVVGLAESMISEILATCDYDFLWIDMEHTPMGKPDVDRHILAARANGAAPFIRVPGNEPALVKPILELGPAGIVFPFVNSAEDAARAVAACRYPPAGVRGYGPSRASLFGAVDFQDYMETSKREPWVIAQIEHIDAVRNLDEICRVPGLGSLVVGPFDLSASVGKIGQLSDPAVTSLMDRIGETASSHGVTFGAFCLSTDEEAVHAWIRRGASWLALDTDVAMIARAGREIMKRARSAEAAVRGGQANSRASGNRRATGRSSE